MIFVKTKLASIATLIILAIVVFYFVLFDHPLLPSENRYERYGKAPPPSLPIGDNLLTRENVIKDLWFAGDKERKHIRIESPLTHLRYAPLYGKLDLAEYMEYPKIYVEEGNNEARDIFANQGTFSYFTFSLNCNDANIAFYTLKNEKDVLTPMKKYFEGTAKSISIKVENNEPLIKADGLSAQFNLPTTSNEQKEGES